MSSACSSKGDDGQGPMAKRPKTEHDCTCTGKCKTGRCFCVKGKRGCGPTCKCKSKCENVFSHLEYLFGPDKSCDINPCFEHWLLKKVKNGVENIDRNALRKRITRSAMWDNFFVYSVEKKTFYPFNFARIFTPFSAPLKDLIGWKNHATNFNQSKCTER